MRVSNDLKITIGIVLYGYNMSVYTGISYSQSER